MAKYTHLMWDFNGTIFDDAQAGIDAVNKMLSERGLPIIESREKYKEIFDFPIEDYYKGLGFDFDRAVAFLKSNGFSAFLSEKYLLLPGFCDVHVHFREPGFSYKETVRTGSMSAARGGFTDVCTMPNLNPVPDCAESLALQTEIIKRDAVIGVHPYGSITVGQSP